MRWENIYDIIDSCKDRTHPIQKSDLMCLPLLCCKHVLFIVSFDLVAINPGFILGPVLSPVTTTSAEVHTAYMPLYIDKIINNESKNKNNNFIKVRPDGSFSAHCRLAGGGCKNFTHIFSVHISVGYSDHGGQNSMLPQDFHGMCGCERCGKAACAGPDWYNGKGKGRVGVM